MNSKMKGKVIYGYRRQNKNKIEYILFNSKGERDLNREKFSKKFVEFEAEFTEVFGQQDILHLKFEFGKEIYITDPEIIKSFI